MSGFWKRLQPEETSYVQTVK